VLGPTYPTLPYITATMCASESAHNSDTALVHCSYGSWHPQYAALTPASRVIQLDQAAAEFLLEDGLVLHEESAAVRSYSLLFPLLLLLAILMQLTPSGRASAACTA
jgi:hypothetical protein